MPTGDLEDEARHKEAMGKKRGRWDDLIDRQADRTGVSRDWLKRIMKVESGGDPSNTTGSYKGLFQLSDKEFKRHGGSGSVYDPEQNTTAAANKLAQESRAFKERHGRDPKLIDIYMVHQQGEAGYSAHMANPEGKAWENVKKYYKSEAVAKSAIWGNLPADEKKRLGSVENVTSKDFVNAWDDRIQGGGAEYGGTAMASGGVGKSEGGIASGDPEKKKKRSILGEESEVEVAFTDFRVPNLVPEMSGSIKSRAIS